MSETAVTNYKKFSKIIPLSDKQHEIVEATMESLNETGQGALSVFTSGGKSYIGATIACIYLSNNRNKDILWFGPKAANSNVYNAIISKLPTSYKRRIHMKSYSELSLGKCDIDVDFDKVCLAIMDESHRALAKQAYPNLVDLLNKCKADRLAMSATQCRTDGRHSFEALVPKAYYNDYDINWAADNNIINDLNYIVCTTKVAQLDYATLAKFASIAKRYSSVYDEYNELLAMMHNYSFKFERDFYDTLKNSGMSLDASDGVRHIVFFNTIENLKAHVSSVKNVFKKLYPKCDVNIWEYHSKQTKTESDEVLKYAVASVPNKNTVDVIISVNKGTESIHPKHIRSVSMFRHTQSTIIFTQQMGRGVTLKDFCDDSSYIFDFSEGYVSLMRGSTIEYGRQIAKDRLPGAESVKSLDEMVTSLQNALSSKINIKAQFATKELREISNKITQFSNSAFNLDRLNLLYEVYETVRKEYKDSWKKWPTIKNLHRLCKRAAAEGLIVAHQEINGDGDFSPDFISWFNYTRKQLQHNQLDPDSETYKMIHKFGHLFYLYDKSSVLDEVEILKALDSIKRCLVKVGYDYSKIPAKSTAGKNLLALRLKNMNEELSINTVCTYARNIGVDLSINSVSIEDIAKAAKTTNKTSMDSFIAERDLAEQLKEITSTRIYDTELAYETWTKLMARNTYNKYAYNNNFSKCLRMKLNSEYSDYYKYDMLDDNTEYEGNMVTNIAIKTQNGGMIGGLYQDLLFKHPDIGDLSLYSREILKIFGINTKQAYNRILDSTEWNKMLQDAINGDIKAMAYIRGVDIQNLDEYRKKKLRTSKFRESKKQTQDEVDVKLILRKAKSMYTPNDSDRKEIEHAIRTGLVDRFEIGAAPFSSDIKDDVMNMLKYPGELVEFANTNPKCFNKIYGICTSSASCTNLLIPNILDIRGLGDDIKSKLGDMLKAITQ